MQGRPSLKPKRLKDGFYVEVKTPGSGMKVMMYSVNREGMLEIARRYSTTKEVTIMGEHRSDKWISEGSDQPKARKQKAS
ncbi:MAG: hypothetical protein SGI87_07865 [Flavobacteriales bacterium]|nr:hypothetical protein [Flavobacteriales bacterium]